MGKFIEIIKRIWGVIAAAIGVVTTIVAFVQLWQGQRDIILWVTGTVGLIVLSSFLVFVGFSKKQFSVSVIGSTPRLIDRYPQYKTMARVVLAGILIISIMGISLVNERNRELDGKIVILLTTYDGPEPQTYRVNEIVLGQLEDTIKEYSEVLILTTSKAVLEPDGSSAARKLGKKYHADLVIWGWYTVTATNVLVTTHIENMTSIFDIPASDSFSAQGTVAQIHNFTIQQKLSNQMVALSLYVSGMARYELSDYQGAIDRFERIERFGSEGLSQGLYINIGNAYFRDSNLEKAEAYYQKAIESSKISSSGDDARAYLALAQVYYLNSLLLFEQTNNREDVDLTLLQKMLDTLNLALQAKYQPDDANIEENVDFNKGQAYFILCYSQTCDFSDAKNSFRKVISSYEEGNEQVKDLAAESHARLGLIARIEGDISSALKEYQQAADLLNDNRERQQLYESRAKELKKSP